jgi:hypothetical protein
MSSGISFAASVEPLHSMTNPVQVTVDCGTCTAYTTTLYITRVGSLVHLRMSAAGYATGDAANMTVTSIPTAYRPTNNVVLEVVSNKNTALTSAPAIITAADGVITVYATSARAAFAANNSYFELNACYTIV